VLAISFVRGAPHYQDSNPVDQKIRHLSANLDLARGARPGPPGSARTFHAEKILTPRSITGRPDDLDANNRIVNHWPPFCAVVLRALRSAAMALLEVRPVLMQAFAGAFPFSGSDLWDD